MILNLNLNLKILTLKNQNLKKTSIFLPLFSRLLKLLTHFLAPFFAPRHFAFFAVFYANKSLQNAPKRVKLKL